MLEIAMRLAPASCSTTGKLGPVEAYPFPNGEELGRGLPRVPSSSTADVNAEFLRQRCQSALQGTNDAGGDARGVPVHAHHGSERLKPEGMGEVPQKLVPAIVMHDRLAHHGAEPRHSVCE